MDFEWDSGKAAQNLAKHGVSFEEATTVMRDTLSVTSRDPDHSVEEERYITFGTSTNGRFLSVSHAERGGRIRLISARVATRSERKFYEEG